MVISTATLQQEGPGPESTGQVSGLLSWSLHDLPVPVWCLSGYFGFLPHSIYTLIRLIWDAKF